MKYFFNPIYWPVWLLVIIIRLITLLPFRIQMKLGHGLGVLIYHFASDSKRIARINVKLCFPNKSFFEREKLVKKSFINLGKGLFETALGFWASQKKLKSLVSIKGEEHIEKLLTQGHSILFLGAHFTTLEIAGRLFSLDYDFSVMYRPNKIGFINFIIERSLKKHYYSAIPRNRMRTMVSTLKKPKNLVWYACDVNAKRHNSIFAPFFGIPTATLKAPLKLPKMTGCRILFVEHFRREDDSGYDINILDGLSDLPTNDMNNDAIRINERIEKSIRKHPDQYLWSYTRFKTRPNVNDRRFYSRRNPFPVD